MATVQSYRREQAAAYAAQWALSRNPRYFSFNGIGGDCTNFVSQCIYAGCGVMNYTRDTGWYYNSPSDRAAAWSGVSYLYRFLITNTKAGPFASETDAAQLQIGDVVQLGHANGHWYHSLLVTGFQENGLLVSTHSFDAYQRPLSSYLFEQARFLHIEGFRH